MARSGRERSHMFSSLIHSRRTSPNERSDPLAVGRLARSYPGLDLVRFAAALMVAVYHFAFFAPAHDPSLTLHPWANWSWVGVELFFVISGVVIAFSASQKNASQFI